MCSIGRQQLRRDRFRQWSSAAGFVITISILDDNLSAEKVDLICADVW